jgi:hypothetical protein
MNINQIFDYINYMSQKHGTGGTLTQDQYNLLLASVSLEYFNELYNPNNNPQIKGGYETNYEFTNSTARFKTPLIIQSEINGNGQFTLPNDYCQYSDIQYSFTNYNSLGNPFTDYKTLSLLSNDEYNSEQKSSINPVSVKRPIVKRVGGYLQFFPFNIGSYGIMNLTYLRKPVKPFWAVTTVNDAYVYDPANSIQLDFEDLDIEKIKFKLLKNIGVNLQDDDLIKISSEYSMGLANTSR